MRRIGVLGMALWACVACDDATNSLQSKTTGDAAVEQGRICATGETHCVDGKLRTCLEDGTGWLVEACPEASVCQDDACKPLACAPGARECVEGGVRRCAADGSAWSDPVPCGDAQSCLEGVCLDRNCTPGEPACGEKVALVCGVDGLHWERIPCDAGQVCLDGTCREPPEGGANCTPGQVLCGPDGLFTCSDDGLSWQVTPCAAHEACFEGRCVQCVRDQDCGDDRVCADGTCAAPPLSVATTELPPAQVGQPYHFELEAANGAPPYRWSLAEGMMPRGLSLVRGGAIDGTPVEAGDVDLHVAVDDSTDAHAEAVLHLRVLPQGLVIATDMLPAAEEGTEYAVDFMAMGGTAPYGWFVVDGALPMGLVLGADGHLGGTPTEVGPFDFRLRAVDASTPPGFAEKDFHLEVQIAPLHITADQIFNLFITQVVVLPTITIIPNIPVPYDTQLQATGGLRPYHWSEVPLPANLQQFVPHSGIPDGLVLDDDGHLHGAVVDPSQVISVQIPFTQITLTGFFFVGRVDDSQGVPANDQAIFLLPTLPIGGAPAP
jgi:hypothetical protein